MRIGARERAAGGEQGTLVAVDADREHRAAAPTPERDEQRQKARVIRADVGDTGTLGHEIGDRLEASGHDGVGDAYCLAGSLGSPPVRIGSPRGCHGFDGGTERRDGVSRIPGLRVKTARENTAANDNSYGRLALVA